jgi:hypothetical protein
MVVFLSAGVSLRRHRIPVGVSVDQIDANTESGNDFQGSAVSWWRE